MKLGYLITLLFFSMTALVQSQNCFDFDNFDDTYLQNVINDNNTYPVGQSFMSENYVDFVKPSVMSMASSNGGEFCYVFNELIVAFNNNSFHEVSFSSIYHPLMVIDNDTIYQSNNPPSYHSNNNINFYYDANTSTFKINGNFDTLKIIGSTNCIENFCYQEFSFLSDYCFDFSNFDMQYLDSVLADQVNYPYGSVFMGDGPIEFIKTPFLSNTFGESDTSFCSIGNYQIAINQNLIDAPFELTFDAMYIEELVVDQDTVFSNLNIPNNYSGNQFDFEYDGNGTFTLSGDFDTLTINTQTNCISSLCIRELPESSYCFDFSAYDNDYLQDVENDNTTYPAGSVFMSSGNIDFIISDTYLANPWINGDSSFCSIGNYILAVSEPNPKSLSFTTTVPLYNISIDGDTITNTSTNYSGNGFDFIVNGNNQYTISGNFDTLLIIGSTNCIWDLCVEPITQENNYCFDFSSQDADAVNDAINDDVNYPVGSVFMSDGDIEFIKTDNLTPLFQQGDTSFCYMGDMIISVANATDPKTLSMYMVYAEMLIIDGDTIFSNVNPPTNYSNSNINFSFNGNNSSGDYVISGNFDTLIIEGQTNCISNVCLEENISTGTEYCFDFAVQDPDDVSDAINDDVNYPVGSVFMSDGDIEFIKPDYLYPQFQQGDTSFCYIGDVIISVANASDPKTLSMYMIYAEMLIIDGDTIFSSVNPPTNYSNSNINFSFNGTNSNGEYVISGNFDTLVIEGQTNCISNLCLEDGSVGINEHEITESFHVNIFPNPYTHGNELKIEANGVMNHIIINDISGKQIIDRKTSDQNLSISLDHKLNSGIYIVNILSDNQWIRKKLIVK